MNVDLINALEGPKSGAQSSEATSAEAPFEGVLRSEISSAGSRNADSASSRSREDSSGRARGDLRADRERAKSPKRGDTEAAAQSRSESSGERDRVQDDESPHVLRRHDGSAPESAEEENVEATPATGEELDAPNSVASVELVSRDATLEAVALGALASTGMKNAASEGIAVEAPIEEGRAQAVLGADLEGQSRTDAPVQVGTDLTHSTGAVVGAAAGALSGTAGGPVEGDPGPVTSEGAKAGSEAPAESATSSQAGVDQETLPGSVPVRAAAEAAAGLDRTQNESRGNAEAASSPSESREIASVAAESASDRGAEDAMDREGRPPDTPVEARTDERAATPAPAAEIDPGLRAAAATSPAAQLASVAPSEAMATPAAPVTPAPAVAEVAPPGPPGTPAPPAAADAVAIQTEWLATRGGGSARLVLHPPELGEIAIRVSLRGGAVDVVMVAQEAAAKVIAEDQAERLAQAFSNRELRMESFEVRRADAQNSMDGALDQFSDSGAGGREDADSDGAGRSGREDDGQGGNIRHTGSAESPNVLPQIVSAGAEAGVDLRI